MAELMKITGCKYYYRVLKGLMPMDYPMSINERTRFSMTNTPIANVVWGEQREIKKCQLCPPLHLATYKTRNTIKLARWEGMHE